MAKIIKAAVIGCGRIGAFTTPETRKELLPVYLPVNHCEAITTMPGIKLISVCDTDKQSVLKAAKFYGVKNTYTDYKKMILKERPDIVTIATRTKDRPKIIMFAAQNGVKGIYAEKPLSRSVSEAETALKSVSQNNAIISYGTMRRYIDIYRYAKKIIKSGKIGKLQQIIVEFGKSPLMWTHPHSIDLIIFFSENADIDYVQARAEIDKKDISKNKIDADPIIESGIIKFKNGVSAIITEANGQNIKLICEKGEILIAQNGKFLELISKNNKRLIKKIKKGKLSGTQIAINEIKNNILNNKPLGISPSEILNGQKIITALASSAANNSQKIKISDINKNLSITGKINNLYA
ncbi:Gfo/Idh/MocA family oxidoreductase [Patescibacteria group bacterium]|nr:Gfo/Idh/MocA family oxidoreductase [Patescibacteria group bacterium]